MPALIGRQQSSLTPNASKDYQSIASDSHVQNYISNTQRNPHAQKQAKKKLSKFGQDKANPTSTTA